MPNTIISLVVGTPVDQAEERQLRISDMIKVDMFKPPLRPPYTNLNTGTCTRRWGALFNVYDKKDGKKGLMS